MKLVVRKLDGTRELRDAAIPAAKIPKVAADAIASQAIQWEVTVGKDGLRRQRPVGTSGQLGAYAKSNPVSAHLFSIAERVETRPRVWEWITPEGDVIEAVASDDAKLTDDAVIRQ